MKVSIMYIKAGGGHLSTARALAKALKALYPDVEIILYDGLAEAPNFVRNIVEKGYIFVSMSLPFLWKVIYVVSELSVIRKCETALVSRFVSRGIQNHLVTEKPDKVVLVNFLLIEPVLRTLRKKALKTKVLVILTDPFTCHNIWFNHPEVEFIVFSERIKDYAIKHGVHPEKIRIFPIVLDPKFNVPLPENEILELKKRYGFSLEKPLVLIAGGGGGIHKGEVFLEELLKSDIDAEIAVVCGENDTLRKRCEAVAKRYTSRKVKIYGFVDFMYELINIASVVITKGGPGTVMETLVLGKPLIIISYIWAQEKGNVEFVEDNFLGFYEPSPKKVVGKVMKVLSEENTLKTLRDNIKRANIRNGVMDVARFVYEF